MTATGMLNPNVPAPSAAQAPAPVPSTTKAAKASGAAPKAPALSDPILKQIEAGVESRVPPQLSSMYKSIVVAGMAVMFSKKTHNLMQKRLQSSNDIVGNVSTGISNLIAGISNEVIPKMPAPAKAAFIPAAVLASTTLMCQMLNYWEKTGGQTVTPQIAEGCVQATTRAVLQKFGIGQQQIQQAVQQGKQRGGSQQANAAPTAPATPQPAAPSGMLSVQPPGGQ